MAIAILLFVGLSLLQFRTVQRTLLTERVAVLARNTAEPFEAALGLGLPLSSVRNAEALLERARQTDDAIISIDLIGADNDVLRHIGEAEASDPTGRNGGPQSATSRFESGRFYSTSPLSGPNGEAAGAIRITLDATDSVIRLWAMGAELLVSAAGFLLVGTLLIGAALRWAFSVEISAYRSIEADAELFETDTWREGGGGTGTGGELWRMLRAAQSRYREAR